MSGPGNNTNELLVNFLGQLGNLGLTGFGSSNMSPGFVQQSTQPTTYYPGPIYYTPTAHVPPPPGFNYSLAQQHQFGYQFLGPAQQAPQVGYQLTGQAQQTQQFGLSGSTVSSGQATTLPQAFTTGTLHAPTTSAWNFDT
ncbi:hypothetical protein Tco_1571913, partial [Tanacetum coccineum]